MLCQICNQNPATIHIQEVANGKKRTLHICAECAAKRISDDPVFQDAPIQDMIAEVAKSFSSDSSEDREIMDNLRKIFGDQVVVPEKSGFRNKESSAVCPVCGWDAVQFRKTGHAGCPACYDALKDVIEPMFFFEQHGSVHCGKKPECPGHPELSEAIQARREKRFELEKLQKNLSEAVLREEYELAAELRDRITAIELTLADTTEAS